MKGGLGAGACSPSLLLSSPQGDELELFVALPSGGAEKGRGVAARYSWRAEIMRSVHRSKTRGRKCFCCAAVSLP
jgi:hypothetical protein